MTIQGKRSAAVDNLRAFLIISVVAGHLLEILRFSGSRRLYVLLYSFHMPAFVFISGICCKLTGNIPKKLVCNYIYPYVFFQTLYITFDRYVLHNTTVYQYTTPYWLLWYLMAMALWQIMLWLYSGIESRKIAMGVAVALSLLTGFDSSIGYYMTLSRTLVLFPFFLAGYYAKDHWLFSDHIKDIKNREYKKIQVLAILLGGVLCIGMIICAPQINNPMLYHSYSYYPPDYCLGHRVVMMGIAALWIGVLFALVPRRKIPWITYCGRNTMAVFVLHGFIMRILSKELPNLHLNRHWPLFVVLTLFIPMVLTIPPVIAIIKPFMRLKRVKND